MLPYGTESTSVKCPHCEREVVVPIKHETEYRAKPIILPNAKAEPWVDCECGTRLHIDTRNVMTGDFQVIVTQMEHVELQQV